MELAQIKDTVRAQPFRPFTMRLVDGRQFVVPHPEFLFIPPNMRHTVLLANRDTEAVTILDSIMIASISFDEPPLPPLPGASGTPGPAGPNGTGRAGQ
jgi:hypothetical protein